MVIGACRTNSPRSRVYRLNACVRAYARKKQHVTTHCNICWVDLQCLPKMPFRLFKLAVTDEEHGAKTG